MDILATTPVSSIVLHIHDLDISTYSFDNGVTLNPFASSDYDIVTDKWTIPLVPSRSSGIIILVVNYIGHMNEEMSGFYRSYYMKGNEKVWLGTTQFQSKQTLEELSPASM